MEKTAIRSLVSISIRHVQVAGAGGIGNSIKDLPGHPAEDTPLENIRITAVGGDKEVDAQGQVTEQETKYPEYAVFGVLLAYGFYCRHKRGFRFINVQIGFAKPDLAEAKKAIKLGSGVRESAPEFTIFPSFTIGTIGIIPEPSTIDLATLGAACLLVIRRRK